MKAALQWSLDNRGQEGQARDNLIWGRIGGHREKPSKMWILPRGSLDTLSHFQLRLQVEAADYFSGAVGASLRVVPIL